MIIHKEGDTILAVALIISITLYIVIARFAFHGVLIKYISGIVLLLLLCFLLFFFRNPQRQINIDNTKVLAPADDKIVAIEEVHENEYLHGKCICVSIFMSVWDVHVNRYPVSGKIIYTKYHPGKYLIAKYPKASELNEHHSTVIQTPTGNSLLVKQIAGIVARRVVCYASKSQQVIQGEDLGFVKFGSRVDIFIPSDAKVEVKINDKVKGNITTIASLKP